MGRARNKIRIDGGQVQRTDKNKIRHGKAVGRRVETAGEILGDVVVLGRPHLLAFSWGWPVDAGAADSRPLRKAG